MVPPPASARSQYFRCEKKEEGERKGRDCFFHPRKSSAESKIEEEEEEEEEKAKKTRLHSRSYVVIVKYGGRRTGLFFLVK